MLQLGKLLDEVAKKLNLASPKANKITASWNKALGTFSGGRGPSASKFQTLRKRFETAIDAYEKLGRSTYDQEATLQAIKSRLDSMSFGLFAGKLKSVRSDLLALAREHEAGVKKVNQAISNLRAELHDELAEAEGSF
ncbi:hypothetical protein [Rhodophyticola sp.]|uniref:hypothetical protein n=1 Tax=Rhodophyticola sp. TaxID=2680032 RepID=UPI003D2E9A9B